MNAKQEFDVAAFVQRHHQEHGPAIQLSQEDLDHLESVCLAADLERTCG